MTNIKVLIDNLRKDLFENLDKSKKILSILKENPAFPYNLEIEAAKCIWEIRTATLRYKNILKYLENDNSLLSLDNIRELTKDEKDEFKKLRKESKSLPDDWPWMNTDDRHRMLSLMFLDQANKLKDMAIKENDENAKKQALRNYEWYIKYSK